MKNNQSLNYKELKENLQAIYEEKSSRDPLFKQQVEECHGYLRRDGSLNIEYIIDKHGNKSQEESFPGEIWDKGTAHKEKPGLKDFFYIQTSSFGRTRKVTKIPRSFAIQQAIDIYKKNYKRTSLTDFYGNNELDESEFSNNSLMNDVFKSFEQEFDTINQEKSAIFNDLVEKILEECFTEDHWSRHTFIKEGECLSCKTTNTNIKIKDGEWVCFKCKTKHNEERVKTKKVKVEPKSWCKDPSSSYTNLAKVFCLLLRQYNLEDTLRDSIRDTINEIIGDVEITRNFDCYVFLGYDKVYEIDPSGSNPKRGCAKYTREIKKIAEILKDFLDIRKS